MAPVCSSVNLLATLLINSLVAYINPPVVDTITYCFILFLENGEKKFSSLSIERTSAFSMF